MENEKIRPAAAANSPAAEPSTLESAESAAAAERVYRIERQLDGCVKCKVMFARVGPVLGGGDYPLQNLRRHSPTGFECGYSGSGPAELAFSILADFFYGGSGRASSYQYDVWRGPKETAAGAEARRLAEEFHQDFKLAFITPLSLLIGEYRLICALEIAEWIASRSIQVELPLPPAPPAPQHVDLG